MNETLSRGSHVCDADCAVRLEATARRLAGEYMPALSQLLALRDRASALDCPTILVAGLAQRGKSSVINALVGADLLPVGTAGRKDVFVGLTYGQEPRSLYWKMSNGQTAVGQLGLQDTLPAEALGLVIACNLAVLRTRAVLEAPSRLVNPTTWGALLGGAALADAIVLVVDGDAPITGNEVQLADEMARFGRPLFVVINKIDLCTDPDELLREDLAIIRSRAPYVESDRVFTTQAKQGDVDDGISKLRAELDEHLDHALPRLRATNAARQLQFLFAQCETHLTALSVTRRRDEALTRQERDELMRGLADAKRSLRPLIGRRFGSLVRIPAERSLRRALHAAGVAVDAEVAMSDGVEADLTPIIGQWKEKIRRGTEDQVSQGIRALAAELDQQLQLPRLGVRVLPSVYLCDPPVWEASLNFEDYRRFTPQPREERLRDALSVIRGGSAAGWLGTLLPGGIVAGPALGGLVSLLAVGASSKGATVARRRADSASSLRHFWGAVGIEFDACLRLWLSDLQDSVAEDITSQIEQQFRVLEAQTRPGSSAQQEATLEQALEEAHEALQHATLLTSVLSRT